MVATSFKDLTVGQKGIDIVEYIYGISRAFPKEERYGLALQMQKAAISIPSNIAEGFARWYKKEFQRFCHIALGSCAELETQLIIAYRQNYVSNSDLENLEKLLNHESRLLTKPIRNL